MAEYLLLIVGDEAGYAALTEEQGKAMYAGHSAFMEDLTKAGVKIVASAELEPSGGARTVRGDGTVTDGPFAEAKEQVGGFDLIDVPTLDEAVEWGKKIPLLPGDKLEVRKAKSSGGPGRRAGVPGGVGDGPGHADRLGRRRAAGRGGDCRTRSSPR